MNAGSQIDADKARKMIWTVCPLQLEIWGDFERNINNLRNIDYGESRIVLQEWGDDWRFSVFPPKGMNDFPPGERERIRAHLWELVLADRERHKEDSELTPHYKAIVNELDLREGLSYVLIDFDLLDWERVEDAAEMFGPIPFVDRCFDFRISIDDFRSGRGESIAILLESDTERDKKRIDQMLGDEGFLKNIVEFPRESNVREIFNARSPTDSVIQHILDHHAQAAAMLETPAATKNQAPSAHDTNDGRETDMNAGSQGQQQIERRHIQITVDEVHKFIELQTRRAIMAADHSETGCDTASVPIAGFRSHDDRFTPVLSVEFNAKMGLPRLRLAMQEAKGLRHGSPGAMAWLKDYDTQCLIYERYGPEFSKGQIPADIQAAFNATESMSDLTDIGPYLDYVITEPDIS